MFIASSDNFVTNIKKTYIFKIWVISMLYPDFLSLKLCKDYRITDRYIANRNYLPVLYQVNEFRYVNRFLVEISVNIGYNQ